MIFKIEAQDDKIFIEAKDQMVARLHLQEKLGPIPARLLKWSVVDSLPEGEEFL